MNSQVNLVEAHERTVGQIFSDAYAFEIPSYRRPYAWEKELAKELLTDLFFAMDNAGSSGGMYFLGSIVLIKTPTSPISKVRDGQQRLTTLTILLSVLRDLTGDPESKISRRSYVFQKANPDSGTEDRYRVLLRPRDRLFFSNQIQKPDSTKVLPDHTLFDGSQARILENAEYFRSTLVDCDEKRRNSLIALIIQHCFVVTA